MTKGETHMSKLIEVRVRTYDAATAKPFTHWPADDLESVVKIFGRWGAVGSGGDDVEPEVAYGQFVVTEAEVYFEVVLGEGQE
jgi:hypothetical protein